MCENNWRLKLDASVRELWRDSLTPYDPELGTRVVIQLANTEERLTLPVLRSALLRARRAQIDDDAWRGLLPDKRPKPEWVLRWERARAAGDERIFPEQIPGYLQMQRCEPREAGDDVFIENLEAYALPLTPVDDRRDWVQEDEYLTATGKET